MIGRTLPRGFTLIEVLVTMLLLAFGLLGLASLNTQMQVAETESYQRAQAVLLLQDMVDRISTNRANAADYVTGTDAPLGTGDGRADNEDCAALAIGLARDQCEWSRALKGAAEQKGGGNVGGMIGGRGCVELIQAADAAAGVCQSGIYRVSVAWQGLSTLRAPTLACGQDAYGADGLRRVIATEVSIGLPGCI